MKVIYLLCWNENSTMKNTEGKKGTNGTWAVILNTKTTPPSMI
jgi:hypothetical protein